MYLSYSLQVFMTRKLENSRNSLKRSTEHILGSPETRLAAGERRGGVYCLSIVAAGVPIFHARTVARMVHDGGDGWGR